MRQENGYRRRMFAWTLPFLVCMTIEFSPLLWLYIIFYLCRIYTDASTVPLILILKSEVVSRLYLRERNGPLRVFIKGEAWRATPFPKRRD
jgi:hypothetical protein